MKLKGNVFHWINILPDSVVVVVVLNGGAAQFNFQILCFKTLGFDYRFQISVTRLGDLLNFWQHFKAFGIDYFAQISYIRRQFV